MSKLQGLKEFINLRLNAAVEEIFGHVERTLAEYEEEMDRRHHKLFDTGLAPQVELKGPDVHQLVMVGGEVHPEQQDWSSSLDQEDPEPPLIKEEQGELWTREGEQYQGLEETDITKFPFAPVPMKREGDEEKPQSSQMHQSQSVFNYLANYELPVSDLRCVANEKLFSCSECGKSFGTRAALKIHMRSHTGEKPFTCLVCKKSFTQSGSLQLHMRIHTGEKPFSCSVCDKRFIQKIQLTYHMACHTGEKPFSCLFCKKSFTQSGSLQLHMRIHTGEKPFSCSVCDKRFTQKIQLTYHMARHTGVKPYSCSVCGNSFLQKAQLKSHMVHHTGQKPFSCSICRKSFVHKANLTQHMIQHTGEMIQSQFI